MLRAARRGEHDVRERWPAFIEVVAAIVPEAERVQLFASAYWAQTKSRPIQFPLPSRLFPGLDATLDQRLIREQHDKDVALCRAIAALPTADQREFYELHLKDPVDAQHWAALPKWKRPIRKGDPDDVRVWKFFTMQRLNMEQAAGDYPPWSLASQGMQLPQMFGGILLDLSAEGVGKLSTVMCTYGLMLGHGENVGDVLEKPWHRRPRLDTRC